MKNQILGVFYVMTPVRLPRLSFELLFKFDSLPARIRFCCMFAYHSAHQSPTRCREPTSQTKPKLLYISLCDLAFPVYSFIFLVYLKLSCVFPCAPSYFLCTSLHSFVFWRIAILAYFPCIPLDSCPFLRIPSYPCVFLHVPSWSFALLRIPSMQT